MNNLVFNFSTYRAVLLDFLGPSSRRTGLRLGLAQALGCQSAYISKVLKEACDLSLEQAQKAAEFMALDKDSTHYFMLLVHKDRAGTKDLKSYYEDQLSKILEERARVINRLSKSDTLPDQIQAKYFSSWIYSAVHVAVSIPELSQPEQIAQYFKLPLKTVNEVLSFLLNSGLVTREKNRFQVGNVQVHLPENSAHIIGHQTNWRLQALKSLDNKKSSDLHYSVISVVSKKDAARLYDNYLELIKTQREIVAPSKEEALYCSVIDFFEI